MLVADRSLERRARLPRQDRRHKRLEPSHQIPLVAGMRAPRGSIAKVLEERVISESVADAGPDADMERYEMLSSVQVNAMGLIRYWRKRWEREAAASAVTD